MPWKIKLLLLCAHVVCNYYRAQTMRIGYTRPALFRPESFAIDGIDDRRLDGQRQLLRLLRLLRHWCGQRRRRWWAWRGLFEKGEEEEETDGSGGKRAGGGGG